MAISRRKGPTPKRRERIEKALRLRKQGLTYAAIGQQLNVSEQTAYKDVKAGLHEIIREPAEDVLKMELERLDEMLARLNQNILNVTRASSDGQVAADKAAATVAQLISRQLGVQERRAKLLGLDRAQPEQVSNTAAALAAAMSVVTAADEDNLAAQVEAQAT